MESHTINTSQLQRLLQVHRSYLATLDNEISNNSLLCSSLVEEIRQMEEKLTEKRSTLELLQKTLTTSHESRIKIAKDIVSLCESISESSPLPDEVWIQIFMDAVEEEESERRNLAIQWSYYALGKIPLSISGVCKRWRRIALEAPLLWRYINLRSVEDETSKTLYPLESWVEHASLPRHREISLDQWRGHHGHPLPSLLASDETNPRQKVQRIEISHGTRVTSNGEWPPTYPLAEEVVLISYGSESICSFFFPLASHAQKLVLTGIRPWPWAEVTWNSLEDLTITDGSNGRSLLQSGDISDLFRAIPNLSRLSITWDTGYADMTSLLQASPFNHGKFKSLTCGFEAIVTYLYPLQSTIILPNLTEIIFHTALRIEFPRPSAWLVVLNTIKPFPLRHLQLPRMSHEAMDHYISLFGLLPCLERLTLIGETVDAFLQRLVIKNTAYDSPTHLPSLKRLDIRDADVTDNTLERLISSRLTTNGLGKGIRQLTEVSVYECPNITPYGWQRVLALLTTAKKN